MSRGRSHRHTVDEIEDLILERIRFKDPIPFTEGNVIVVNKQGYIQDSGTGGAHVQNTDTKIIDTDGDTVAEVEQATDEDKFRVKTGGTERVVIDSTGLTLSGGQIVLPLGGTAGSPTMVFGVGGTDGIFVNSAGTLKIVAGGAAQFQYNSDKLRAETSTGAGLINVETSGSVPGFLPRQADADTGIGWNVADSMALIAGGVNALNVVESGGVIAIGINTTSPDRLLHAEVSDAVTAAITYALRLSHISSGTVVADFGTGIEFELEGADGTNLVTGAIENVLTDPSTGAEDADFVWNLSEAGEVAAPRMRLTSAGELNTVKGYNIVCHDNDTVCHNNEVVTIAA